MVIITESDVYHSLSYSVWKSMREIRNALGEKYNTSSKKITIGAVYANLGSLKNHGYIENRERQLTEEQLRIRGGNKQLEWRLTSAGIQNKNKYEQRESGLSGENPVFA